MFISFLLKNWQIVIIGLLSAAIAALLINKKILISDNNKKEAELKALTAQLGVSQASVKSLQIAINDQNLAIDKLKKDSDEREAAGKILVDKAKLEALKYKRRADELMKLKPTPGKTQCESAEELINQEIRNAK